MIETSKHFQVLVDRANGNVQVRFMPGVDTGETVIFKKLELEQELEDLLSTLHACGRRTGHDKLQAKLKDLLGIERPA